MDAFPDEAEQMSKEADWPLTSIPDRWNLPYQLFFISAVHGCGGSGAGLQQLDWSRAV